MRGALKFILLYVLIAHSYALFTPKNYRRQHRTAYLVNGRDFTPERRHAERFEQRSVTDEPEQYATQIYEKREIQHCARSLGKRCRVRPINPDSWHTPDPSQGDSHPSWTETDQTGQATSRGQDSHDRNDVTFGQGGGHDEWQTAQEGDSHQTGSFQSQGYSYGAGGHYSSSGSTSSVSGSYNAHSWGDSSGGQAYNNSVSGSYDSSDESNHASGGVSGYFASESLSGAWGSNPHGDGTSAGFGNGNNWLTDSVGDSGSPTATGEDALTTGENGELDTGFGTATGDAGDFGTQTGGGGFDTDETAANTAETGPLETGDMGETVGPGSQTGAAPAPGPSQTGFDSTTGDISDLNPQTDGDGFDGFATVTDESEASQTDFGTATGGTDDFDFQASVDELATDGFATATDESVETQTGFGGASDSTNGLEDSNSQTGGDGFATDGFATATDESEASQTGSGSATGGTDDFDFQASVDEFATDGFATATGDSEASQAGSGGGSNGFGSATGGAGDFNSQTGGGEFATATGEYGASQTGIGGATDGLDSFDSQTGSGAHETSGASATNGSGSHNGHEVGSHEWYSSSSGHSSSGSSEWSSSSNSSSYHNNSGGSYNNNDGVHSWNTESGEYHTAGSYSGSHESYASSGFAAASGSYSWVKPGSGYVYGSASGTASGGGAPLPTWLAGSPKNDTPGTSEYENHDGCACETDSASYSSAIESDFGETAGITDEFYSSADASETTAPTQRDSIITGVTATETQPSGTLDPSGTEDPATAEAPAPASEASEPSASASSGSGSGDADGYLDGIHNGEATHYDPGSGACGLMNTEEDLVAALPFAQFDGYPGAVSDPNQNPICGKEINVRYKGNSVTVAIVDKCENCVEGDVDLTKAAFRQLEPLVDDPSNDPGRIEIEWEWA